VPSEEDPKNNSRVHGRWNVERATTPMIGCAALSHLRHTMGWTCLSDGKTAKENCRLANRSYVWYLPLLPKRDT
jgi:hypothetical protein